MATYGALGDGPSRLVTTIAPHDANALALVGGDPPRRIYVGGAGDVTLRPLDGSADVVFKAVPVGMILNCAATHVRATGTTATFLLAMY